MLSVSMLTGACPTTAVGASRLYPNMRKNSSADLRGSRNKSDITATESAPASMTDAAVLPRDSADRDQWLACQFPRAAHSFKSDDGSGFSLLGVANTGPMAR